MGYIIENNSYIYFFKKGYSITNTITRSDIAGRDITTYLGYLLRKNGHLFNTSAEMEVVKSMKENCCYVSFNMSKEKNTSEKSLTTLPYILPDGSQILVSLLILLNHFFCMNGQKI